MERIIQQFISYLYLEQGLSKNTIDAYSIDIKQLTRFCQQIKKTAAWDHVCYTDILDFLETCFDKDLKASSIARKLVSIKVFFRYLCEENILEVNITDKMEGPRLWRILPDFLNESEVKKLLRAHTYKKDTLSRRNHCMLELLYATGIRVSELIHLRIEDISLSKELLRVKGKGEKIRLMPLCGIAKHTLKRYLLSSRPLLLKGKDSPYVFISKRGRPLTRAYLWQLVRTTAKSVGIRKTVYPHLLRHSFASHLLSHGADLRIIQELLGHANISTTEIYTHIDQARLFHIHRTYHPRA